MDNDNRHIFPPSNYNPSDVTNLLLSLHKAIDEMKEKYHSTNMTILREHGEMKDFVRETISEFKKEMTAQSDAEHVNLSNAINNLKLLEIKNLDNKIINIDDKFNKLDDRFNKLNDELSGLKVIWRWLKIAGGTVGGIIITGLGKLLWDWLSR